MLCRNCGAPLKSGMKFCQACGTKAAQICPACGAESDPSSSYCPSCGYAINAETDVLVAPPSAPVGFTPAAQSYGQTSSGYTQPGYGQSPSGYTQPVYGQSSSGYTQPGYGQSPSGYTQPNYGQGGPYNAPAYAGVAGQPGGSGRLRSELGSMRMLVGSILLSLSLLFLLFGGGNLSSLLLRSGLYGELWDMAYMLDMEDLLEVIMDANATVGFWVFLKNLFAQWPLIVVIIGLWTTYAAARNTSAPVMKEGGMSAIQTVGTILSVLSYIGLAFWALACIISAVVLSQSWFVPDKLVSVCILLLVVGCAGFVFVAIFYKKVADTVKSLRLAVRTGRSGCVVSGFAFVVICIIAVINAIGAMISFANVTGLFACGCQAAALFVFAGCLKRCKDPMQA